MLRGGKVSSQESRSRISRPLPIVKISAGQDEGLPASQCRRQQRLRTPPVEPLEWPDEGMPSVGAAVQVVAEVWAIAGGLIQLGQTP